MVASRDLWTQRQGEEQDKINQVNRQVPPPTHPITEHRACPGAGDSGGEWVEYQQKTEIESQLPEMTQGSGFYLTLARVTYPSGPQLCHPSIKNGMMRT